MDTELETVAHQIGRARCSEEVFGMLAGQPDEQIKAARLIYHSLSKVIHPDRYSQPNDRQTAHHTMTRLNGLWVEARDKIKAGRYHVDPAPTPIRVSTRKRSYDVGALIGSDDVCRLYTCQFAVNGSAQRGVFKIARAADDNDLVAAEAQALRWLRGDRGLERLLPFVPEVYDSFLYDDGRTAPRQANIVSRVANVYSLEEIRAQYPRGLDPKDAAWIWRKLLIALGLAEARGIIHGAVLPPHILIEPVEHGLILDNWVYALKDPATSGEHLNAIAAAYEAWYPSEVLARQPPTSGLDIYMGARCMAYLLGGDPRTGELPASAPTAIASFLRGCLLPAPDHRPQRAWDVLNEFTQLIERLWGPRTFRPFKMPAR
jgi:serine/threonine protein kinase